MSKRPDYEGDPTLARVMVRPKWILALLLALAVAAGFASLAQWQMGTAVMLEKSKIDSEEIVAITDVTSPQTPVTEESAGRMLKFNATFVDSDTLVVADRMNHGEKGAWVVGHAVEETTGAGIVVALGWLPTSEEAKEFAADFKYAGDGQITGRYQPQESVMLPGTGNPVFDLYSLSVGQIINLWEPFDGDVFAGFIVSDTAPDGLQTIDSVPPLPQETINWLNLFYAVEWIVFAGFAVFFWYRLARDAWEKEHEIKALTLESK